MHDNSLILVVSRLGLEPRALALKAPPLLRKINAMTLRNRPTSDRHLQRVTVCVSYIGQIVTVPLYEMLPLNSTPLPTKDALIIPHGAAEARWKSPTQN
jgi:hypothetical protein